MMKVPNLGTLEIRWWYVMAAGVAVLGHCVAILGRVRMMEISKWVPEISAHIATATFVMVSAMELPRSGMPDPYSMFTLALAVWALAILGVHQIALDAATRLQIGILILILLFKWGAIDGILASAYGEAALVRPVLHRFSLSALILGVVVCFAPPPMPAPKEKIIVTRIWIMAAIAFLWMTLEALRVVDYAMQGTEEWIGTPWIVKNVTISVLWATIGFACILWGFGKKHASVRWTGLVLLGITVVKVLLVDMANVQTVLRILSFVVVGVLLLGVSFLYHRQSLRATESEPSSGT
jgi:uncharacterized membrane protein